MPYSIQGDSLSVSGPHPYIIPLNRLGELQPGCKKSDWIFQLGRKTWMDQDTLYSIAEEIHRRFPASGIDWLETFLDYEQSRYVNTIVETEQPIDESGLSLLNDLKVTQERDSLEQELLGENDIMGSLRQGVEERLRCLGLM